MKTPSRRIQRGNANLLRLAHILDNIPPTAQANDGTPLYEQSAYLHECGAPSCALGHWAAHNPLRWVKRGGFVDRIVTDKQSKRLSYWLDSHGHLGPTRGAIMDFALNYQENEKLFSANGCDNAGNDAKKAARYIRAFVRSRAP